MEIFNLQRMAAAVALSAGALAVQPVSAAVDLGNLLSVLDSTADGAWAKVNLNLFSDAWPDVSDRSLPGTSYSNPSLILKAWSSFAWDSNRGQLLLFGGGHGNYAGNEVYAWQGSTQQWTLASLPSRMVDMGFIGSGNLYVPADGAMNAPTSIHTYDSNEYLPIADRMVVLGGAAFNTGGSQLAQNPDGSFRVTGPYLWDPNKADVAKVGGTTGSANDPAVIGGQMWQNRDIKVTLPVAMGSSDGTSAVAVEQGVDVVYYTASYGFGTDKYLYRYAINDVSDPSQDQVTLVGPWSNGPVAYGAAGYDPERGFYVAMSTGGTERPFVVWDTRTPGPNNGSQAVTFASAAGIDAITLPGLAGIDWSPTLDAFVVWNGAGSVWSLRAPASGLMSDVWALEQMTDGDLLAPGAFPTLSANNTGVRGKWKYIPNLNAFIALDDSSAGNVWLYRPDGWTNPVAVPEPETVVLMLAGLCVMGLAVRKRPKIR